MRVGVFGGTFDPVHRGHLHVARRARRLFGLDLLHFVVAGSPPHKRGRVVLPFAHRYAMVALATSGVDRLLPSLVELEPPASPFSVDTMDKLARRSARRGLFFIAGGDSLLDVKHWRSSEALLERHNFVFVVRPRSGTLDGIDPRSALPAGVRSRVRDLRGLAPGPLGRAVRAELAADRPRIYVLDVDAPDVSSSEIRELARAGRAIGRYVPARVRDYIRKLRIYGGR
jgi:nicotinate-nucleotide adenylyltransferase